MIQNIIRWFFDLLCCYYLYFKLLNFKLSQKKYAILLSFIFIGEAFLFNFINACLPLFAIPVFVLLNAFILTLVTKIQLTLSLLSFTISLSVNFIFLAISGVLIGFALLPFFYGNYNLPYALIQISGGLLELLLIFLLFKIKRLRRGMPFLYQIGSSATGFILSCFILLIVTIISFYDSIPDMQFLFLLIALFLIGLLLYCWWRFRITRDYREKLRQAELKALQNELIEKDNRIRKLEENNDALAQNINFSLHITGNIVKMTENIISGEDLSHLLADLLENAMIAIGDNEVRSLSVCLCHDENTSTLEISDSGNAFDVQLFEDFGQTRHTTHKDSGGSGIGLMDIWKIKKQYRASLHIIEYTPGTSIFTKKIALFFDRKNHYLIQSYRRNEIERVHMRNDMFVLQSN